MTRRRLVPLIIIFLVFACSRRSEGLKQNDMSQMVNQFLLMHVKYHALDDNLSARILDNYINTLDYGKYYFYKSDIDGMARYKTTIDDMVNAGSYEFVTEIFDIYKNRFYQTMTLVDKLIAANHDFNVDESLVIDRDSYDFATSGAEMEERWRKNVKLQLLNYISAGKTIDEARTRLKKKYNLLRKSVDELTPDDLLARFLNALSMSLDPHSNYLTREEHEDFTIQMELKLEGIGVRLRSEDGFVIVESIIPGGAADKLPEPLRLKPGDRIVAVAQGADEPVDVIDMDLRDVVKKIRGKQGTEVRLTLLRDAENNGGTVRSVIPITREEISLQDSEVKSDIYTVPGHEDFKIGYIDLPSFYQDPSRDKSSAGDMRTHLEKMNRAGVRALVLDLRGNPGGLLTEAAEIAGLFITSGPIVQIKAGNGSPQIMTDDDGVALYSGPLVVLVDRFSASASEILAGAIRDYHRGIIVGPSSTYGKGTVQSYNPIPAFPERMRGKKGAIKVTTHIFYQPGGTSNQLNGIAPDITVPALSSVWDIGENKSKYPLTWEPIRPASFTSARMVSPSILGRLKSSSDARIKKNPKYRELLVKIAKYREKVNKKVISLREESSIEKDRDREMEQQFKREDRKKVIDPEDLMLNEAFNITADYVGMTR